MEIRLLINFSIFLCTKIDVILYFHLNGLYLKYLLIIDILHVINHHHFMIPKENMYDGTFIATTSENCHLIIK